MLQTKGIKFQYEGSKPILLPDLHLSGGDELLILGKSGSGKTTILNILGGLLPPQHGEVIIDEVSLYHLKGTALDKFRGRHIGIVFQKPHLLKPLTVEENIGLANFFVGQTDIGKIDLLLSELDIVSKRKAAIETLSEGEAQRVSIARALANSPKVILADEPTASLDDDNAQAVIKLLQSQSKKLNAVLIIVTHDQRVKEHIVHHLIMEL
ncbi:MAG TPA: ATP-binding cassette domain-containing protein [Cyclobacteriaceae bacterium]|nr:ATP-binding cassette domain-containing protein [Cyclobacteriaceae bacterium]